MRNIVTNQFLELFNLIPEKRVYIQNEFETFTYNDVKQLISHFQEKHSYLEGKNCALIANSRFDLAKSLPLIASLVNKIFLQPLGLNENVEKEFYIASEIEYVIKVNNSDVTVTKIYEALHTKNHEQEWLFSTSGTTGTPKLISYNLGSLIKTSKSDVVKGANFKWGLCYDLNRFAGFQVYLQAIASGSSLTISEPTDELSDSVKLFIRKTVNCLSATPSYWRKMLMTKDSQLLNLIRITLGGEISDQAILNALKKQYEQSHIVHIYASTEAGVGFSVKDCIAGFPLDYVGPSSFTSVELKIDNDTLWIKSDRAASSMLNGAIEMDNSGFINTGDIIEIRDGRVLFVGRESGTINVGGNKVIPEEIESILNSHPDVVHAKVFGKKNPVLGMLVNAEVVSKVPLGSDEKKILKKRLISFCKGKLEPFKIPAMIKFVATIAVNESGKIVRK